MEQHNITEVYTWKVSGQDSTIPINHFRVTITGVGFTRTVFRSLSGGPELVIAQERTGPIYDYRRLVSINLLTSRDILLELMRDNPMERTDQLTQARLSTPGATWLNVVEKVTSCAEEWNLFSDPPVRMQITGVETFGTVFVMNESNMWTNIPPRLNVPNSSDYCFKCSVTLDDVENIELGCGHRFHKECFFWHLWSHERTKCMYCLKPFFD